VLCFYSFFFFLYTHIIYLLYLSIIYLLYIYYIIYYIYILYIIYIYSTADNDGDELSGNVNNDVKIAKFSASSCSEETMRLRVFLDLKEKDERKDNFFALIMEEKISELDQGSNSKLSVDKADPRSGQSAFLACCEHGKIESLRWLLQKKASINQRSADGSNGLHIAIANGRDEVVDLLVAMGVSVSETDGNSLTPFLLACQVGNIHAAKLLLRRGAKKADAQRDTGHQGIHLATLRGNTAMMAFLVGENKVSLESRDRAGMTPYLCAVASSQLEVCRWLVEKGCDVRATSLPPAAGAGAGVGGGEEAGTSALHIVGETGDMDIARYLLEIGVPTDGRDAKGVTVVAKAKACGHPEIADLVLDREICGGGKLDVELFFRLMELQEDARAKRFLENFMKDAGFKYSDRDKVLLLHLACACGHMALVEYFVLVGCDLNERLGVIEATPLMQACKYGNLGMVKYLLSHEADPSLRDRSGVTAMRVAVLNGHGETATYLGDMLKARKEEQTDIDRRNPIQSAGLPAARRAVSSPAAAAAAPAPVPIEATNFGMLFACISGMDANPTASQLFAPPPERDTEIESTSGSEEEESSEEEEGSVSGRSSASRSSHSHSHTASLHGSARRVLPPSSRTLQDPSLFALHCACRAGSSMGLLVVLAAGMKGGLDTLDHEGHTALYIACALSHWEIARHLISQGADAAFFCDSLGETPLHVICHNNAVDVLQDVLLLRSEGKTMTHCTPNLSELLDMNNNTLLHSAILGNAREVVCVLLDEVKMDMNQKAAGARTPLHLACLNKFPEIAFDLLDRGADLSPRDAVGGSALLCAVKSNELELVQFLLSKGSDVNDKTETGNTVMHIACQLGNLDMAMFLYNKKASLLKRNAQGMTPYTYAVKCKHPSIMQWIASVERKATL
jgi:ankyrin repeat protein